MSNTTDDINSKINAIVRNVSDFEEALKSINSIYVQHEKNEKVFEVLWGKAIKPQEVGGGTYIAALSLYRLDITCPLLPLKAIEEVCDEWDISIEEVPWYLAQQFSKETILNLTNTMKFTSNERNVILKSISYWVNLMP